MPVDASRCEQEQQQYPLRPAAWIAGGVGLVIILVVLLLPGPPPANNTPPVMEAPMSATASAVPSHTLPDVPPLSWGRNGATTFCGALAAAAEITHRDMDYPTLMAATGLAFRVRWFRGYEGSDQPWCPSSPVGEFPEETILAAKATGWKLNAVVRMDQADPHMEQFAPRIIAELKAGRPVIGYDHALNCNLIFGVKGDTFLTRDYFHGDKTVEVAAERLGPMLMFLGEAAQTPALRDTLRGGISQGVRNWTRDGNTDPYCQHSKKGRYLLGAGAYDQWIADLKAVDADGGKPSDALLQPTWWTFDCLVDARRTAAKALRTFATSEPAAAEHLLTAADRYEALVQALSVSYRDRNAFLGPWSGKKLADWTPEVRAREIALLGTAKRLDGEAIAALEKALAAR